MRSTTVALSAFLLVVAACSSGGAEQMPPPPISGRGFAGSACSDASLIVWGGAPARNTSSDPDIVTIETFADGAIFDSSTGGWGVLAPAPLTARWGAVTAVVGGQLVVWSGAGNVRSLQNPTDFDYPSDGAVLDLSTMEWVYMPEGMLEPRFGGAAVPLSDRKVFIYGGQATPGTDTSTLNAAFIDLSTLQVSVVKSPPVDSVVFTNRELLLAIDSVSVYEYAASLDEWNVTQVESPAGMSTPIAAVPIDGDAATVVVTASGSWIYRPASGFIALNASPTVTEDAQVRSSTSGATIWDPTSRSAWILRTGGWEPLPTPRWLGTRDGASVCQTPSTLIVWGGWEDRDTVRLTRDDGLMLRIDG